MSSSGDAAILIEPRWLLPFAPGNAVLEGHAVSVRAGRIEAVGPVGVMRERCASHQRIVRERHALLPGLVAAHTCPSHTLLRGIPVRPGRTRWLRETLTPIERRLLSAELVRDGTRLGLAEMVRAGITCYADDSPIPTEAARVAAAAQVRALIGLPVADGADAWAEDTNAHFARAEALWDEYRSDARIGLYFLPKPVQGLTDASWSRLRRLADELDARVVVHLDELVEDCTVPMQAGVADGAAWSRPAARARRLARLQTLGLLRSGFSAVGALGCSVEDAEVLARQGATLIACPQAELRLRDAEGILGAGPPCALGTDTPAAAGALDLLAEARAAALLFGLAPLEALRLATLGGATTLGLAAEIGSIEPGKAGDLTCVDLGVLGCRPVGDVPAAIVFGATRAQVSDVWSAGRAVVSEGRLRLYDEAELATLAARWAERLSLEAAA